MSPMTLANQPSHETTRNRMLGAVLCAEHRRLLAVFGDMMCRAEAGDFRLCDEAWDSFAADLEKHFGFEEAELFPRFADSGDDARAEVAHLSAEHRAIRRRLFELGVGLQTRTVRHDDIEALLADLGRHAEREDAVLYPWASATYGTRPPVCELVEDG